MAMPVHANFFAAGFDDFLDDEFHQVVRAVGNGVADGVAEHDGAGAAANRRRVKTLDGVWDPCESCLP